MKQEIGDIKNTKYTFAMVFWTQTWVLQCLKIGVRMGITHVDIRLELLPEYMGTS